MLPCLRSPRGLAAVTVTLALALALGAARPARAHLATWGSWDVTRRNLDRLFPGARRYLQKRYTFDDAQVGAIEKFLGFKLYPEDRTPVFFVAMTVEDGREKLLGVGLFIDPRVEPRVVGGQAVRLEVGVAVDEAGRVARVLLYDYKGKRELTEPAFLDQLKGRSLASKFTVGGPGSDLRAVPGEEGESQLVANAAREALFLMQTALGAQPK
jgi:hypothetical protein